MSTTNQSEQGGSAPGSGRRSTPPEIFISYHRATHLAQAGVLHQALTGEGLTVFKDDQSLHTSDHWLEDLQTAVQGCRRFVVLLGPRGLERWVGAETSVALNRHYGAHADGDRVQIVPVFLPGAPDPATLPFLGLLQGVRWEGGKPPKELIEALTRPLDTGTTGAADAAPPEALLPPDVCPWVGLAAFQKEQARRFFGRERDVLAALDRLGRAPDTPALALVEGRAAAASGPGRSTDAYRRWLHIVGGSGSGKSSLMRAGLLPLIEQGALSARTGLDEWIVTAPMLPGRQPVTALARLLCVTLGQDVDELEQKFLRSTNSLCNQLCQWAERRQQEWRGTRGHDDEPQRPGLLLVIDQFEELFTLCEPEQRKQLDGLLTEALAEPASPLHLVTTCRSDYQHRIADDLPRLAGLLNTLTSLYTLTPMSRDGLEQAITAPARLGRLQVQPALVQALLDDADEDPAAALPLVQHAMEALWLRPRRSQHAGSAELTLADYESLGRLGGILATEADRLLASLGDARRPDYKGALELLSALAHFHPEGRHTRQSLTWVQACRQAGQGFDANALARGQHVIDALSGQRTGTEQAARLRLVTVSGSATDAQGSDTRRVDLIHEALLRSRPGAGPADQPQPYWPRLVEYLTAHKDRDLLRQNLRQEAEVWPDQGVVTRLLDGPGRTQLRRYDAVRFIATEPEQRYLTAARKPAWARTVVSWGIAGWLLSLWAPVPLWVVRDLISSDTFQDMVMAYRWRHTPPPIPRTVEVPPGEFDYGCKPGRDDKNGIKCRADEAWRHVDLRQMKEPPCTAFGQFKVTQAEYDYFVWQSHQTLTAESVWRSYPSLPPSAGFWHWRSGDLPSVHVYHNDAVAYAEWLSKLTGQTWRLPTEEEWEYAARAPGQPGSTEAAFWWGPELPKENPGQPPRANCDGCDDRYQGRIAPVGSYAANPFGLHDTAGGAWEWTKSVYTKDNQPADPKAVEAGSRRVLRGGSWSEFPVDLRASVRGNYLPDDRDYSIGFRVCRASPMIEKPAAGATGR